MRRSAFSCFVFWLALNSAAPSLAQTVTASIRGQARNIDPRTAVTARDVATDETITASVDPQGRYALSGLQPGTYRLTFRALDGSKRMLIVTAAIGQSLTLDLDGTDKAAATSGQTVGEVVVTARRLIETRTSEVATNVSTQQIRDLPQTDRNFLSFAALAPGVRYNDSEYTRTFTAGAGNPGDVNVFIDGLSLKNDVEPGGLAGQEGSRGNPFPQIAVSEFRTLVQNYKAEYEQASSAIITAVTKSGTNQFHGDAFFQYTDKNLTAQDPFSAAIGAPKPDYERKQYGVSLGGPILKDRLFFFVAYEGNDQIRSEQVRLNSTDPALVSQFSPYLGFFASPFHEDLYFGKLTWLQSDRNRIDASVNVRRETDLRGFGLNVAYTAGQRAKNDVDTYLLRDTFRGDNFVNEAAISFLNYHYNPQSISNATTTNYAGYIETGGATETNDVHQKTFTVRDDFTRSGVEFVGNHTFKAGLKFSHQDYEINDQQYVQPYLEYRISTDPGSPLYGQLDTQVPYLANLGVGNPNIKAHNNQIGVYLQDDWDVTSRLQLNLGLRWDYETNMFNNNFVTPANAAAALRSLPTTFYYTNPNDYISNGHQRPPETDMFQPRIGFSYDVFGDQRTVLFGGYGRYFDRNIFAETLNERYYQQYGVQTYFFSRTGNVNDEGQPTILINPNASGYQNNFTRQGLLALQAANPATTGLTQLFVVKNDARAPRTDQFTFGLRQRIGIFYTSIAGTYIDGSHGITNIFVNREHHVRGLLYPHHLRLRLCDHLDRRPEVALPRHVSDGRQAVHGTQRLGRQSRLHPGLRDGERRPFDLRPLRQRGRQLGPGGRQPKLNRRVLRL